MNAFDALLITSVSLTAPLPAIRCLLRLKKQRLTGALWLVLSCVLGYLLVGQLRVQYGLNFYFALFVITSSVLLFAWSEKHLSFRQSIAFDAGKERRLITSGPYAHIRHPRYLSLMLFCFGLFLTSPGIFTTLFFVYILISHYLFTIVEERDLVNAFGKRYLTYQRRVPRFVPKLKCFYSKLV